MIYANQAGSSWPKPSVVRDAVAEALVASPETWADRYASHNRVVARAFGVDDPGRMLLTPGATSALAVGVMDLPWQAGDRVIVSGFEHHALHRPVLQLVERGVELVVAENAPGEPVVLESLERELARGGTRLVAMTAACNVTGELLPIAEISRLARRHGALFLVDAAQIAGWSPLDARSFPADLFAFAGHKGPHGPWGVGGLYVAPHVETRSPWPTPAAEPDAGRGMIGACEVGSADRTALAGLVAGLAWVDLPERADRLEHARARVAEILDGVRGRSDLRHHGPDAAELRMPTIALTWTGGAPDALERALLERDVVASAGSQCAPLAHHTLGTSRGGVLRISLGPGNDPSDPEAILRALRDCVGPDPGGGVARR